MVKAFGQVGDEENLVDVVDAWGQPLPLHDGNERGVLPNNRSGNDGNPETWQFRTEGGAPILKLASAVRELRKQQAEQRPHLHLVPRKHRF